MIMMPYADAGHRCRSRGTAQFWHPTGAPGGGFLLACASCGRDELFVQFEPDGVVGVEERAADVAGLPGLHIPEGVGQALGVAAKAWQLPLQRTCTVTCARATHAVFRGW
jgi:hypothetical protein